MSKTEEDKDPIYFNYYGQLQHQQNMLEDHVRTETYFKALMDNRHKFEGKIVLDVGTGTGILSFFAAQAGAKRVYAVEGSAPMARIATILVENNGLSDVIKVIEGKIEDVELPEKVDIIISEPMGVLLFHERMIESYIFARNKFLKPSRLNESDSMFPANGSIFLSPFTDGGMYSDFRNRNKFWQNKSFYGIDLSSMTDISNDQTFRQPVVGGFDPKSLFVEGGQKVTFNFCDSVSLTAENLKDIRIPFSFDLKYTGIIHGIAGWFNVGFPEGESGDAIVLDTSPECERTHWQQCRFFFTKPIGANSGQVFCGEFRMVANEERSYHIFIEGSIGGISVTERFALQDQQYFNLTPVQYPTDVSREYYNLY
jgi:type I protein arginine methyltransferase